VFWFLVWVIGLGYWFGLLVWVIGLGYWFGLLVWVIGVFVVDINVHPTVVVCLLALYL